MSTSTRVLVIDDHAIVRAGICAALEKREDFAIFQAASKSEALAQMAKLTLEERDGTHISISV